jgi:hypothetical protein
VENTKIPKRKFGAWGGRCFGADVSSLAGEITKAKAILGRGDGSRRLKAPLP